MKEMKVTLKRKKTKEGTFDLTIILRKMLEESVADEPSLQEYVPSIVLRADVIAPPTPIVVRQTYLGSTD